ncbi:pyruvate dehydrogenase E2 component (dihydrolipoamide acetyltransferase) [Homoserinimonas aerilata]|uniref:Dihydrolipoamide acetyltransferase component of pyruvate dehydrogenase complex n=1 Tax=Homoserinimonas aerilata TaxID=1162970 RepID=A0A542YI36_9MICO|nr:dihydrolipoamide acetyltransferase family protein [Homoserinimonas aerilata]TQL47718.1 pyruvate dehydrogenase E2 component (dihydrolipoamide acetyltransferase) [Homoserinimonas aerilata]
MSTREFTLPDLGEGLTESELVTWQVSVGDSVELNQVIAEVETAKALVELPSPFAGTISRLFVEEGTTVKVGQPIVSFELEDGEASTPDAPVPDATAREATQEVPQEATPPAGDRQASEARTSVLVGYGPRVESGDRPRRRHRRAEWLAAHPQPAAAEQAVPGTGEQRTPISGVRRRTAEAMVASAFTAPHASVSLTVDVTPSLELLERLRLRPEFRGRRVNILTIVAKAVLIAIGRTPQVNAHWDGDAGEIVEFERVNLGIAAATPRGLLVPNIRDAGGLSLPELADALGELSSTAKEGFATLSQLSGGTFTITNIGVFGVDTGTPILTPGEAAILALGAVRRQPWEHRGEIALRDVVSLCVSFDHRVVDGEQAARFLTDVGGVLSDPGSVLALI